MKKIIAIAVMFALVAGAVFAQGWSLSGGAEINSWINLKPREATVGAGAYHWYSYYGGTGATLGAFYTAENGLKAGFDFSAKTDDTYGAYAEASFSRENAAFQIRTKLSALWADSGASAALKPERLWGYFKMFDGLIHIEVAPDSRDTSYWQSNISVHNLFATPIIYRNADGGKGDDIGPGNFRTVIIPASRGFRTSAGSTSGYGNAYNESSLTKVDHDTYVLVDFNLSRFVDGLSLGALVPDLVAIRGKGDSGNQTIGSTNNTGVGNGYFKKADTGNHVVLRDAFAKSVFGIKYASTDLLPGPFDVALQFALMGVSANSVKEEKLNTGLYAGLNYGITDTLKAGLNFKGYFEGGDAYVGTGADGKPAYDNQASFGIAASVNYTGITNLGLGVEAGLMKKGLVDVVRDPQSTDPANITKAKDKGVIGIKPSVTYKILPDFLAVSLDTHLFFLLDEYHEVYRDPSDGLNKRRVVEKGFGYEITPTLWINPFGTGISTGYYGNNNGIYIRYKNGGWTKNDFNGKDESHGLSVHSLDITFKWGF